MCRRGNPEYICWIASLTLAMTLTQARVVYVKIKHMNYADISEIVRDDLAIINEKLAAIFPVNSSLNEFLTAPSKRIRPLLAFLYMRALDKAPTSDQYSFLTAIELIHNASLIHDDIIDNSNSRRGGKSLNIELGTKLAVICGDFLLSQAMLEITGVNEGSARYISLLSKTMEEMCLGELSQQYNLFKNPTKEEYLQKTEQKTASLFATTLAGCGLDEGSGREFGKNFGIAFQIHNDLAGIKKDAEVGICNTPATHDMLEEYLNKALEYVYCLEDNKYKQALVALLELFKDGSENL